MPDDSKKTINTQHIKTLAQLLRDTGLAEIEYETENIRIRVAAASTTSAIPSPEHAVPRPQAAAAQASPSQPDSSEHDGTLITAPLVGTVYRAAEPGADPFVKEGDSVTKGDTLLIIEAMKTMNPVQTSVSGTVVKIFVNDAEPVEYGEKLVSIKT